MSRNSRKRRRKQRQRQEAKASSVALVRAGSGVATRVSLRVHTLELALGHDGLLRGMPEPVVLLAVYGIDGADASLAGRYLYRFARPPAFPCKVEPAEASQESCALAHGPGARFVVLALAVEEDDGRGIARLYAALTDVATVVAWDREAASPSPLHLSELGAEGPALDVAARVHVLFGDWDPADHLPGDDWIDASVVVRAPMSGRALHRLHFRSADARNDWTAEVEVTLARA